MRRKHYLIKDSNGKEVLKGDAYEISKYFSKASDTIKNFALANKKISFKGESYTIETFEHLYQFIDADDYVVYEGPLHECAEEMCCSCQSIIASASINSQIDGYKVKAVEYLQGYGYYE